MGYIIKGHLEKEKLVYVKPKELMPFPLDKGFKKKRIWGKI